MERKIELKGGKCRKKHVIVIFRVNMLEHFGEIFSFVKRVRIVTSLEYGEISEYIQTSHLGD